VIKHNFKIGNVKILKIIAVILNSCTMKTHPIKVNFLLIRLFFNQNKKISIQK